MATHLCKNTHHSVHISGQIMIFHQPRIPWNNGISLPQLPFGVRSCEVAKNRPVYSRYMTSQSQRLGNLQLQILKQPPGWKHLGCSPNSSGNARVSFRKGEMLKRTNTYNPTVCWWSGVYVASWPHHLKTSYNFTDFLVEGSNEITMRVTHKSHETIGICAIFPVSSDWWSVVLPPKKNQPQHHLVQRDLHHHPQATVENSLHGWEVRQQGISYRKPSTSQKNLD